MKDSFVSQSLDIHSCHSVPASTLALLCYTLFFFSLFKKNSRSLANINIRNHMIYLSLSPGASTLRCKSYLGKCFSPTWKERQGDDVSQNYRRNSCSDLRFRSRLTLTFIHGKYQSECSSTCRRQLLDVCRSIALPLLPSLFYPLPLSVPHCQCREHSGSYRPQPGNTQQTRKMTASAISFSEGLQVRQEMAIIPSTLSVLSYFLL